MTCDRCKKISNANYTTIQTVTVEDGRKTGKDSIVICANCATLINRYLSRFMGGK